MALAAVEQVVIYKLTWCRAEEQAWAGRLGRWRNNRLYLSRMSPYRRASRSPARSAHRFKADGDEGPTSLVITLRQNIELGTVRAPSVILRERTKPEIHQRLLMARL